MLVWDSMDNEIWRKKILFQTQRDFLKCYCKITLIDKQ